jgi:hypothetical protein
MKADSDMSDLEQLLADLEPDVQGKLARERAPSASTEELIRVLERVPLCEWAELHVTDALAERGLEPVEPLARAILTNPLSRAVGGLCETLVLLYQREPSVRSRVAAALIAAAEAALDAGGGSQGAMPALLSLRDCVRIEGPLPEAVPVAERLLIIADAEQDPCTLATGSAQRVLGLAE